MTERKIIWESYHIHEDEYSERDEILNGLNEEDEDDAIIAEEIRNAPKLVESPFGLVEISDSLNPFRLLKFWMIHANFNINGKVFVMVNFIDGVEAVKTVSRYKLLVGFGDKNLFDHQKIKEELEHKLINIDEYSNDLYKRQRKILLNNSDS